MMLDVRLVVQDFQGLRVIETPPVVPLVVRVVALQPHGDKNAVNLATLLLAHFHENYGALCRQSVHN